MPYRYEESGELVQVGDKGKDFRGDEFEIIDLYEPGTPTGRSGGRVALKYADHTNLYFPGVAKAVWSEE